MSNNKKRNKRSFSSMVMLNLFGGKEKQDIFIEEEVESPLKTIINTFKGDKVAMFGLTLFILIVAVMLIGPLIWPIDLSFSESSQGHVPPGYNLMKVPDALQGNVEYITVGSSFSVGIDKNGKVYVWGESKITDTIDIANVPKEVQDAKIVKAAAGQDHVIAVDEAGKLYAWGNNRHQQTDIPFLLQSSSDVVDIAAGYQISYVITSDGQLHAFGNAMNNDFNEFHDLQGQFAKVSNTASSSIALTKSGEVVYMGTKSSSVGGSIPTDMKNIVDIASTNETAAAINDAGEIFVWGYTGPHKFKEVPEMEGKPVKIVAGAQHYSVLTDAGKIFSWGSNNYKQSEGPKDANKVYDNIFAGYYQNYAVDSSAKTDTWGLKGYLFGTDESGRPVATRLLNGGRMSLFIGAIAVVISVIIGVVIGGVSGYYGGRIDVFLQRISEMVSALPFLPFAMLLSALIGNRLPPNQKTLMIMVVLGLLSWPGIQRTVRAQVLSVREQEYVTAARALGIKNTNIVFKHILPNVISVIIVSATLSFASSMLTEATLSFLGFGVQPPQPTWGNMLYAAKNSEVIQKYWWRWVYTSAVLSTCVICINMIGDGLRDAIDPKSRER